MKKILTILATLTLSLPAFGGQPVTQKEVLPPPLVEEEEEQWWAFDTLLLWESKYISEGRDNLEDGGLVSVESVFSGYDFSLGFWYADSYDTSYNELNLFGAYAVEFYGVAAYAGYSYLNFPDDDADDHEISAGLAYEAFPYLIPAVEWVYSTGADGSFVEISLASEIPATDYLSFTPFALLGLNLGYVAGESEGLNNFQLGLDAELAVTENIALVGYAAHTWGLDKDPGDSLIDEFWGGAGLAFSF
jgi:hypothetical protein